MEKSYDVIILGGGPAGITSAIYSSRYALKTLVVTESFGGTITGALEVENWPGQIASGTEIMMKAKEQAESFGTEFLSEKIKIVKKNGRGFTVETENQELIGKTIIYSLGTKRRKLEIPGEKEFAGKGVSYCATCDGMFFKDKKVAIIGGANSAAEGAIYLSKVAEKVYIIYRKEKLRAEPGTIKQIEATKNIEVIYNSVPLEIIGDEKVQSIKIKNTEEQTIDLDGIFVEIGADPITSPIENLGLNIEEGYIKTDKDMKTNVEGFFSAGDVTNNTFKQMVVAAGEGALATKSAYSYLNTND